MEQPVKVAMPAATGSVVPLVQERLPAAGLVPIARVMTVVLSVVTTLLLMSRTATRGCWAQTAPAGPPPGWVMNARWLARPLEKAALAAGVQMGLLVAPRV